MESPPQTGAVCHCPPVQSGCDWGPENSPLVFVSSPVCMRLAIFLDTFKKNWFPVEFRYHNFINLKFFSVYIRYRQINISVCDCLTFQSLYIKCKKLNAVLPHYTAPCYISTPAYRHEYYSPGIMPPPLIAIRHYF